MENISANLGGRKDAQMLPVLFMERNRNTAVWIIFWGKQSDKEYHRRLHCEFDSSMAVDKNIMIYSKGGRSVDTPTFSDVELDKLNL